MSVTSVRDKKTLASIHKLKSSIRTDFLFITSPDQYRSIVSKKPAITATEYPNIISCACHISGDMLTKLSLILKV